MSCCPFLAANAPRVSHRVLSGGQKRLTESVISGNILSSALSLLVMNIYQFSVLMNLEQCIVKRKCLRSCLQ